MALFTMREVKEGKPIILNVLKYSGLSLTAGSGWEDYSDKDYIAFVCDEERFGSGFRRYFGSGSYHGNVSVGYTPEAGYLKMEIYFSQNTISPSTLRSNANFVGPMMGFDVQVMTPPTNGLNYPYICISKTGVRFSELKLQTENMLVTAAGIVDAN